MNLRWLRMYESLLYYVHVDPRRILVACKILQLMSWWIFSTWEFLIVRGADELGS
jgi:hypothetical protein